MTEEGKKELLSMLPVYGVVDVKCGRERRYIHEEEDALYFFDRVIFSLSSDPWEYCIGDDYLCRLETPEEVIGFLSASPEVDVDDPMPVDLAEYYLAYDSSSGVTERVAELCGMAGVLYETAEEECDPRVKVLIEAGYPESELYNEVVKDSDIRYSEIMKILKNGGSFDDVKKEAEKRLEEQKKRENEPLSEISTPSNGRSLLQPISEEEAEEHISSRTVAKWLIDSTDEEFAEVFAYLDHFRKAPPLEQYELPEGLTKEMIQNTNTKEVGEWVTSCLEEIIGQESECDQSAWWKQ